MAADTIETVPLRLCLASRNYFPFFGGAALRFSRYLPGLRQRGVDTAVFAALQGEQAESRPRPRHAQRLPPESVGGFPVHRVACPDVSHWRQFLQYSQELGRFCRDPAHRPDVLHILNLHRASIPTLRALRRDGIPIVSSSTQIGFHDRRTLRGQYEHWTFRIMYGYVDAVIASTDVMRDWLVERGVRTPIEVIYNGVDLTRFRPAGDDAERMQVRNALGIAPDARVVIVVGAIEARKRLELLLGAWAREEKAGRPLHVIVAGPGEDRARWTGAHHRRILELLEASSAPSHVHFTGSVDDIEAHYRAADVFALTTEREGMNNAIFEAMATGLPVLLVPFEGLTGAHGRPDVHYQLCDADVEAVASGLRSLFEDRERAGRIGEAGRAWAAEHVDVERSLDQHAALYRELASRRRDR